MVQTKTYSLDEAKRLMMDWRTTRASRRPIPDVVWDAVLPLIGQYSYSIISKELGLSYQQIKKRIESGTQNATPAPNSFVSFAMPQESPTMKSPNGCKISFTKLDGTMITFDGVSDILIKELLTHFVVQSC